MEQCVMCRALNVQLDVRNVLELHRHDSFKTLTQSCNTGGGVSYSMVPSCCCRGTLCSALTRLCSGFARDAGHKI